MTPMLVFDLETIPDVAGLRRLNDWGGEVSDLEVVERAFAARREAVGHDFLPLHLHQVAVVGCVFRDDQGFRVKTLGQPDDPEAALLSGFSRPSSATRRGWSAGTGPVSTCRCCTTAA